MTDREQIDRETAYVSDLPGFKRTQPQYFQDPMVDHLLEIVLLMGGELWSLRHRQAVTERLLASGGAVTPDTIETFQPDAEFRAAMAEERKELLLRLFSNLPGTSKDAPSAPGFAWATKPRSE